jgi:hypothetical protein
VSASIVLKRRDATERCSYVLSRAWTAFRWPISVGVANEDFAGL